MMRTLLRRRGRRLGRLGIAMQACGCLLACLLLCAAAHAGDAPSDAARAQAAFDEAVALMKAKRIEQACLKFEESQRLGPSSGAAFNVARCSEQSGRTATAWAQYAAAETLAREQGKAKHQQAARRARQRLEPKLSKLVIEVPEASRVAGLEIQRDGAPVEPASWGVAVPVDPGAHLVGATAPGRVSFETSVSVAPQAAVATLTIPLLDEHPAAPAAAGEHDQEPAPPPAPALAPPPSAAALPPPAPVPWPGAPAWAPSRPGVGAPEAEQEKPGSTQRGLAVAVGTAGLAGVAIGAGFGIHAIMTNDESKEQCNPSDPNLCSVKGKELRDEAFDAATVSTVALMAGGVALVGGVVLYLTAPSASAPPASAAGRGQAARAARRLEASASLGGLSLRASW